MPNRIIKESINESRGLAGLSRFAQDLFKRLITYADDYGRFNADLEIMRARLYPLELDTVNTDDLERAVTELIGIGKVSFYRAKADIHPPYKIFGHLPGWANHQRVRNTRAKCPEPDEYVNDWYLRRFIPVDLRLRIFIRDNFTCQECGHSFKLDGITPQRAMRLLEGVLHIDHLVPVKQGGRATEENLRALCASCNLTRSRNPEISELLEEASGRATSPQSAAICDEGPPIATSGGELRPESESESNPISTALPPPEAVGESDVEVEIEVPKTSQDAYPEDFLAFWKEYPRKIEKKRAFRCWKTRLRDGAKVVDLIIASSHYAESCRSLGTEERYMKHPSTFLGPDKPWEEYVNGPPVRAPEALVRRRPEGLPAPVSPVLNAAQTREKYLK